jgi:hypothetical protein
MDKLKPEVVLELRSGHSLYTAHHGKQAGNLEHEQPGFEPKDKQ